MKNLVTVVGLILLSQPTFAEPLKTVTCQGIGEKSQGPNEYTLVYDVHTKDDGSPGWCKFGQGRFTVIKDEKIILSQNADWSTCSKPGFQSFLETRLKGVGTVEIRLRHASKSASIYTKAEGELVSEFTCDFNQIEDLN